MTAKVTISLPDELLERLDLEAATQGVPRSELVQESVASYLGKSAQEREREARSARVLEAVDGMRTFHDRHPVIDERTGVDILREVRDADDSTPVRDVRLERMR